MNATHQELLQRLEDFRLDSPEAMLPFSGRLAKEDNWPTGYTQRVIAEYKRFAFLAIVAGHPVSPSEAVDQAWHLHLTYTENYWKSFCADVLGRPLHHHPTKGGAEEHAKFQDWYARTLESYQAHFGEAPPTDIWPTPDARKSERHHFVRVDKSENWVIPKPGFRGKRKVLLPLAMLGVTALCTGAVLSQRANPLDWSGPNFLWFYIALTLLSAPWQRWCVANCAFLPARHPKRTRTSSPTAWLT